MDGGVGGVWEAAAGANRRAACGNRRPRRRQPPPAPLCRLPQPIAGRALYSTADHSLHLAVVAKRLPAGDHKAAERLRKAAPAEAESFALRVEQDQEAAGHDFAAVASAVCFAPGRLEFVLAPLPAGTTPTCYSAFRRCRSALGKVLRPPASPPPAAFAFPPADPISPASTVVGGEDLGTPTLGNGAAMVSAPGEAVGGRLGMGRR